MRVHTDDELHTIHAIFLGPKGWLFPWRARYVAYALGFAIMVLATMIERVMRVPFSFMLVVWTLLGTIALTRFLGKFIDYERPLNAQLTAFWHEVNAPRLETKAENATITPARVRIIRKETK